jgi:translation initiation factor 2 subunit 3
MAKEKIDVSELPVLNVGVVGHIDHGKTTLLNALTGKFADTHSEELKRGITIKLGYADILLRDDEGKLSINSGIPKKYLTFVDVPGHEMLMATMLSGAAMIDAAILVVAANEGIKPQTKEHLVALQAKKIKNIIIVQNKIDLVSKEKALENYKEIKEFVKGTVAENSMIIPVSAEQKINLEKIYSILYNLEVPERDEKNSPIFVVARSFDINRPGTEIDKLHGGVLGGALKRGILKIGDEIEIKPGRLVTEKNQKKYETVRTKIKSIFRGSYPLEKATPGGSLSLETELDMAMAKTDLLSGTVAGLNGSVPEIVYNVKIKAQHFNEVLGVEGHEDVDNFKLGEMLMMSVCTSTTIGKITRISGDILDMQLSIPIVPFQGDNVGLARNVNGHWRLIGFGEVVVE